MRAFTFVDDLHEVTAEFTPPPSIEVHDVNRRCVTVYADVNGVRGVVVRPERPMRDEEYQRAIKSSPFEPPDDGAADPPEGDAVPVDAEPLDEAIAEGPASEGGAAPGESEDAS